MEIRKKGNNYEQEPARTQGKRFLNFISASRADLAMRGFAISFLTLARVALSDSCLTLFFIMHP
jgi:hypothetical protein